MGTKTRPPKWIKPQLTRLVDEAPSGDDWLHEIKYDGYRMHARIAGHLANHLLPWNWAGRGSGYASEDTDEEMLAGVGGPAIAQLS